MNANTKIFVQPLKQMIQIMLNGYFYTTNCYKIKINNPTLYPTLYGARKTISHTKKEKVC